MLRSRVCRILLAVLADVYLSNFMLWISKRKALVVPPDKVFPSLIAFHTKKKKILLPIITHNYLWVLPCLSGLKFWVLFFLATLCHLCPSRLFSVSNTLSPHHFCLWVCPSKLPVVGFARCVESWYNPGNSCTFLLNDTVHSCSFCNLLSHSFALLRPAFLPLFLHKQEQVLIFGFN